MKQDETRADIIEATRELFTRQGFYETSMSDIVEASDTSKGTLYYYFDDKLELFESMIEREVQELYGEFSTIAAGDMPVREKMREILKTTAVFGRDNFEFAQILLQTKNFHSDFEERIWEWHERFHEMIKIVLKEGVDRGVIEDKDLTLMTYNFQGLIRSFAPPLYHEDEDYDIDRLADFTLEIFLEGVCGEDDSSAEYEK